MKHILFFTLATLLAVLITTPVKAHVLVIDSSHSLGLVLHISPDDEPVAGQQSTMYFDLQNTTALPRTASLTIKSETEPAITIPVVVHNNSLSAQYSFNDSGIYTLVLTIIQQDKTYTFYHTQRVVGDGSTPLTSTDYQWAKLTLIITGSLLAALAIIAINRRKFIGSQSK